MQTIHLSFDNDDANLSETFWHKLNLFQNGSLYNIYESNDTMTMNEVKTVLGKELSSYYNAELLINDWEEAEQIFETYVSYQEELGYGMFWAIAFYDHKNENFLNLYLEDETGKLLFIHYDNSQLDLNEEERIIWLEKLMEVYDETLKLLPDAQGWIREDKFSNSQYYTRVYSAFSHEEYGEFEIEFDVNVRGFYIR